MRCHCCRRAPPLQRPPHNACTRSRDALVCAFDPPEICPFALFKPWQKMDLGRPSLQCYSKSFNGRNGIQAQDDDGAKNCSTPSRA
ncbi:uncharacterized protein LOC122294577 isoform X4 [Carya illinoinensis]|uniref:uncharacterized protein LOC122294577 isoform X4 n=1 Tax=Carya illinoinensis TaxID=32201 RepID=UPI001C726F93|nr:uncharacterized protein LOC122294577 isoform X4 [Carya illinoinensis]